MGVDGIVGVKFEFLIFSGLFVVIEKVDWLVFLSFSSVFFLWF